MRFFVPIIALLVWASVAHAQPDNRARAKAAFARAVDAEERQDWRTAVDEYLTAYELAPHPDVLFNVATVYERLNELRQAATYYRRYLQDAPDAPDRAKVERTIEALRKKPSAVTIESAPAGAVIIVDGERKGRAPLELKLPGGEHHVVAEHSGTTAQRRITVEYAEPAAITLAVGGNGTLVVTSNEAGAVVRLDGNQVGVTPFTGVVAPGRHTIVVEKPGFTTVERVVEVPPDGTAQITAGMVRPLGFIEPTTPTKNMGILLGVSTGGAILDGVQEGFDLTFGWRSGGRRADVYTGVAIAGGGVGYSAGGRAYILTGRVRPYLGVGASLVTSNSVARGVGGVMLADLGKGRTAWDVHFEVGVASAPNASGERVPALFVLTGLIWHLRQEPPPPPAVASG
ncbi:MAG: PEGA domain-containing protein, partial [Deltaproteobacteria bacterium]|nr:PEGA domain-containing protein [Kofleriaceae bacterium]